MAEKRETQPEDGIALLAILADEEFCYITTIGRISGRPHEIEIWFGFENSTLYLLSGGMDRSDWVKNLLKDPSVTVRFAKHIFSAAARIVKDEQEELMARYLLAEKYQEWEAGKRLSQWACTVLPVALNIAVRERS